MKMKKQILMLLLALLVGLPTLSAQSKKEKKEQKKEAVKELIVSENYKIDVNTAMPMRGPVYSIDQFILTGNQKRFGNLLFTLLWSGLQYPLRRRQWTQFQSPS